MADNKTLRKMETKDSYVIIVMRDGVFKYVSKEYHKHNAFQYTVLLTKALRFRTESQAYKFIEVSQVENLVSVYPIEITFRLKGELK